MNTKRGEHTALDKRKRRLVIICCAAAVTLAILVCALLAFVLHLRASLTVDKPVPLDIPRISKEDAQALSRKYMTFKKGVMQRKASEIELESGEIDKMIMLADEFKSYRGKASFKLDGSQIRVKTCLPMPPLPLFGGRYLCGEFVVEAFIKDGQLSVTILKGVTEDGRPFPEWIIGKINRELSAPGLQERLGAGNSRKVDSMTVSDSRLILKTK